MQCVSGGRLSCSFRLTSSGSRNPTSAITTQIQKATKNADTITAGAATAHKAIHHPRQVAGLCRVKPVSIGELLSPSQHARAPRPRKGWHNPTLRSEIAVAQHVVRREPARERHEVGGDELLG